MSRNKKHIKGDVAELIAAEFFLNKGFYVFRNISQHGPADLTVLDDDGNVILIDVKAVSLREKNGWKVNRVGTMEQERLGIQLLYVNLDTREVSEHAPRKGRYKKNNVVNIKKDKTKINTVKKYLLISSKSKLILVKINLFINIFLGLLKDKI